MLLLHILSLLCFFTVPSVKCFSRTTLIRRERSYDCQPGYFVCNGSKICIKQRYICDTYKDCEDGSDEWNCNDKQKDKYFNSLFVKRPDEDRDKMKVKECKLSSTMPICQCSSKSLYCENRQLQHIPAPLPKDVKELDLSGNFLSVIDHTNLGDLFYLEKLICNNADIKAFGEEALRNLTSLKYLYLNGNKLQEIKNVTFVGIASLQFLYLSFNPIENLEDAAFLGLNNVEELSLRHCRLASISTVVFQPLKKLRALWLDENYLITLPAGAFRSLGNLEILSLTRNSLINVDGRTLEGLFKLSTLYLTSNSLTHVRNYHFGNRTSLLNLDLQDNDIYTVEAGAFETLKKLISLNLKGNPLRHIQATCFEPLVSLRYIYFSNFYSCSLARSVRVCEPRSDGVSSFSHLLDSPIVRWCVWLVAAMACLGNACVMVGRTVVRQVNGVHSFYIKNLAIADFLMSLYLFLIAGHDVAFRGEYIRHDVAWRHSWQCTLAGMLSTISSEASIFIMTIITVDRYLSIMYPLMLRRRSMLYAGSCITLSWITAITLAILPVFNLGYFGSEFYGNNGLCLPLQIHDPFSNGWQYSMAVFCGINSLAFGFISYAYVTMFITISRSKLGLRSSQQQQDRTIAKRFAFIVVTDMACWVPIIIIKILAVSGVKIYAELYAWVAVFMLPINSAINPVLYTLTTQLFKQQLARIVYTWRAGGIPVATPPGSSGISMSSTPFNGRNSKNSVNLTTSDLDRSISRSSLLSANSRTSARCNWPSPLAYIVYQNTCF